MKAKKKMAVLNTNLRKSMRGQRIESDPGRKGWEVIRVQEGSGSCFLGNDEYALSAGTLLSIPPGQDYCIVPNGDYVDIRLELSEPIVPGVHRFYRMQDDQYETAGTLMGLLGRVWNVRDTANYENLCNSLQKALQDLLIGMVDTNPDQTLLRLAELMHDNIPNARFNIAQAIAQLPQTVSYTRRQFKIAYGCTPTAYMNRLRVGVAKLYLLTRDLSIAEVAYACGFRDAKYFTRQFRLQTGMTPTQFAETHRQMRG